MLEEVIHMYLLIIKSLLSVTCLKVQSYVVIEKFIILI